MAFDAGAIVGRMGLDTSGFMTGMLQVQSITSLFPSWMTNFIANPILGVIGLLKDAASAIKSWVLGMSEADDAAIKLADRLGVSVEWLTAYSHAADLAGVGLEELGQGMTFLNRAMAEAASGEGTGAEAFRRLGVSVRDAAGNMRSASDVILDVGEAINQLPASQKIEASMDLFSRSGATMINVFGQGRESIEHFMDEAGRLHLVVSEQSGRSAEAFNDLLRTIERAWDGVKRIIAEPIRDALTPYLETVANWFRNNPEMVKAKAKEMAETIAGALNAVATVAKLLIENLRTVLVIMGAIAGARAGFTVGSLFSPVGGIVGMVGGATAGAATMAAIAAPPAQVQNVNVGPVNVQAPPLDQASTTRIAEQMAGPLRDGMRRQGQEIEGQFRAASIRGGI